MDYTQIESLEEHVLAGQDEMEVTLFRRSHGWKPEILRQPEHELNLNSLSFKTPFKTIYEGVKL